MSTFELARKLNCIETIMAPRLGNRTRQLFDFILVLDFEATCWEKTAYDKGQSEIIEFPCVLYDVRRNEILEEFQQYVMPTERPKLTPFCTELTGIQQYQVDNGVPLKTCLYLFQKWVSMLVEKFNISFDMYCETSKKCIFATWSDWDLGVCLTKECRRKLIHKDQIFNRWMDVRSIFVGHYGIKPQGLEGALLEVGLIFLGRPHCGLDDAKNTAMLIGKMISDGVMLRITKDTSH